MSEIPNQSAGALGHSPSHALLSPNGDLVTTFNGFTPRTPVDKSAPETLTLPGLVLGHTQNKEKQAARLRADVSKAHVAFESKHDGADVIIECSSGFYEKVAKPTFCKLSPGFLFNHPSSSFELQKITPTVDSNGTAEKTLFSFCFLATGIQCKLTITLFHTTRRVHVQGQRVMPDGSKAAHWFVKHIMHDHFLKLARENEMRIEQFHAELLKMDSERIVVSSHAEDPNCAVCGRVFRNSSKPKPCPSGSCQAMAHTTCVKKHHCASLPPPYIPPQLAQVPATAPSDASALQSLLAPLSYATAPPQSAQATPAITSSRKRSSADVSFIDSEVAAVDSTTIEITPMQPPPSLPTIPTPTPATQVTPAISLSSQTWPPSGPPVQLVPSLLQSTRPKIPVTQKPPPKKAKTLATTPDSVQNEFLNNELDIAKAKISSLESALLDRDNTIKLYAERLKAMEEVRFSSLSNHYLTPTPPSQGAAPLSAPVPPPPPPGPQFSSAHLPPQCPEADSMAAVKVELSQLRDIVGKLQTSVQSLNSKGNASRKSQIGEAGHHAPRPFLLPTPPNPWLTSTPQVQQLTSSNIDGSPHPWLNQGYPRRAAPSHPVPKPASRPHSERQFQKALPSTPFSYHAKSNSLAGRSRNNRQQLHHPQLQQQRQPGGSLGGVRLPISAADATKSCWRHKILPPANQTQLNTDQSRAQHPAGPLAVEVTIPVQNRFAPLSENLNM